MRTIPYIPSNFEEYKRTINVRTYCKIIIRWNDLKDETKEYLARRIKQYSPLITLRKKVTEEEINLILSKINIIIDRTRNYNNQDDDYNNRWNFDGAYITGTSWLRIISITIIIALKLRKIDKEKLRSYYKSYGGFYSHNLIEDFLEDEWIRLSNNNLERTREREVTLTEIHNTTTNNYSI